MASTKNQTIAARIAIITKTFTNAFIAFQIKLQMTIKSKLLKVLLIGHSPGYRLFAALSSSAELLTRC